MLARRIRHRHRRPHLRDLGPILRRRSLRHRRGPISRLPIRRTIHLDSLSPRAASILCYVPGVGWIASVVLLASKKFRTDLTVRFHAFQGLYLFALFLLDQWVLHPFFAEAEHVFRVDKLISGLLLGVAIFMMIKASHDEAYVLPIIGELAQRSAHEK